MPSGYQVNNVDLDDLLEARVAGDGIAAATDRQVQGVDLNQRYAPAAAGNAHTAPTGHLQNGVDIGPRFATKGSRGPASLPINGQSFSTGDSALTSQQQVSAAFTFSLAPNGTYQATSQRSSAQGVAVASGTWNTFGGAASAYEAQITVTHIGGDTVPTLSGSTGWVAISSGPGRTHKLGPYAGANASEHESLDRFQVQIRRVSDQVVVSTSTFNSSLATAGYA